MVLSQLFLSFAVVCQKEISVYIHFAINCNNPVNFFCLTTAVLHTEIWSHHHSVCLESHEETETDLKKPTCNATVLLKVLATCVKML